MDRSAVDRAALDWAMKHGLEVGGWCPKKRLAEDGPIPRHYPLLEAPSTNYLVRTRLNVRDSDGTLIVTNGRNLSRGSLRTSQFASELGRPRLHIRSEAGVVLAAEAVRHFCNVHRISILNAAGTRASMAPNLGPFVAAVLDAAFPEIAINR